MAETENKYTFIHLENKKFKCFNDTKVAEYLAKWSLKGNLKIQSYSFNEQFQIYKVNDFVRAFFTDSDVINTLKLQSGILGQPAGDVFCEQLLCSTTSMSFFDRLKDPKNEIVMHGNAIRKCIDTPMGDFMITDKLRMVLLDNESEEYNLYSESDRKQFLFCLFKHLCLGGEWCQYEDNLTEYLEITQSIYKDLISVQKDPETNMIFISSVVLRVEVKQEDGTPLFPINPHNEQNFVYLIVNPFSRRVTVLSHTFGGDFAF